MRKKQFSWALFRGFVGGLLFLTGIDMVLRALASHNVVWAFGASICFTVTTQLCLSQFFPGTAE